MDTNYHINQLIQGYSTLVATKIEEGHTPYFITFMFKATRGPKAQVMEAMEQGITRAYETALTRMVRKPLAEGNRDRLPVWLLVPDYPVPKHAKSSLREVVVNDGLHYQGVAFTPPQSRLKIGLDRHFATEQALYTQGSIERIHAVPITKTPDVVVDYVFKSVGRRRVGFDSVLVLPRPRRDMVAVPHVPTDPWRPLVLDR